MKAYASHIKTPESITITWSEGDPTYISSDDTRFKKVNKLLFKEQYDKVLDMLDVKQSVLKQIKDTEFSIDGYTVMCGKKKLPETLSKKIIEFSKNGEDVQYLVNFWNNLKQNKSETAKDTLYKFLDKNKAPITPDGCFITYKKVGKTYKDGYTGKIDYSPGNVVQLDRDECDPNPNNTCSSGLHVAAHEYAANFGGSVLIKCKVNPRDVISVPRDYQWQKMRVCRLQVLEVHKGNETQNQTYKKRTRAKPKKHVTIVRIPADRAKIFPNGKGTIRIPNDILAKFNVDAGDMIYGIPDPKTKTVTVYMRQEDVNVKGKVPDECTAIKVGLEFGFISASLRDEANLGKKKSYSIKASKGTLIVT